MASLANTILFGSVKEVKAHLTHGQDVNQIDEYGFTPLIESAIANRIDMAELLLQHGAEVDQADLTGRTALHWAVDNSNEELAKLLLEHKANANSYSRSGLTPLVYPLLRNEQGMKELLYRYAADLNFTQDFINAKLIGHRFELPGQTYIVDSENRFILLDYEGFIFEFTSGILQHSLERFKKNYAAKHLQAYFPYFEEIINALNVASELMRYQSHSINREAINHHINALLAQELLLIPVAYRGHAITYIKYHDYFVKIDRGEYGIKHGTVLFYRMGKPTKFNEQLCKNLLYVRNDERFVHQGIQDFLKLQHIYTLPLSPQIIGNCSWANVEAVVPAMLLLLMAETEDKPFEELEPTILDIYNQWHEWDKDRALDECVQSFNYANASRKASKAMMLAGILGLRCDYKSENDIHRATKILEVLATPGYEYVLETYIRVYCKDPKNAIGSNLKHLLDVSPSKSNFAIRIQDMLSRM